MRVLITRERAEPLQSMFTNEGLEWIHVPLIALRETGSPPPDGQPDGVLITSASVCRFVPNLQSILGNAKVVAVGESTAKALTEIGVNVHHVGHGGGLEALELLQSLDVEPGWYVGAKEPSPDLGEALKRCGLTCWPVYQNHAPLGARKALLHANFNVVTFTSGSAVHAFVEAVGVPQVPVVVLGQSTRAVAESLGVQVSATAGEPTMRALVDSVSEVQILMR